MADLHPFPMDRLVGRARHVAALYVAKTSDHARRVYWDSICRTHTRIMQRVGFDDATINRQLEAFAVRVNYEIGVLTIETSPPSRDGTETSREAVRSVPGQSRDDGNHPSPAA